MDDDGIAEQLTYYRRRAATYYDELYEVGAPATYFGTLADQLGDVLDGLEVGGDVLELAPGPGIWTEHLVPRSRSVLAVDGAPEMLAVARERVPAARYEQADLPDGTSARIVKVFHDPDELAARLDRLGWDAEVRPWGAWFLTGVATPR